MDNTALNIVLAILRALVTAVPAFAEWLSDLLEGRTDPISLRVSDILPVESASRAAQRELEGGS